MPRLSVVAAWLMGVLCWLFSRVLIGASFLVRCLLSYVFLCLLCVDFIGFLENSNNKRVLYCVFGSLE